MTDFIEQLSTITGRATSENTYVRATVSTSNGTTVAFGPRAIEGNDENSLAAEIEDAVYKAQAAYARELRGVLNSVQGSRRSAIPEEEFNGDMENRRSRYRETRNELNVEVSSPRKYIKVVMYGDGETLIQIAYGVLRRADIHNRVFIDEINTAINDAKRRLAIRIRESNEQILRKKM